MASNAQTPSRATKTSPNGARNGNGVRSAAPTRSDPTGRKPQTPSGGGMVSRGRLESRDNRRTQGSAANGTSSRQPARTNGPVDNGRWWDGKVRDSDHPARIAAVGYHRLADTIYSPEVGDLRATSRLQDERLFTGPQSRTGTTSRAGNSRSSSGPSNGTGRNGNGGGRNGNGNDRNGGTRAAPRSAAKPPAKASSKTTKAR
jgi:hypothetical protein